MSPYRKIDSVGPLRFGARLPCLFSNNSTETSHADIAQTLVQPDFQAFSTQHKKSACALAWNVEFLAENYGLDRLGFLTLTFAENVLDPREAQRRFNSLSTHVLRLRYSDYIRVWERTKKGRIHYHLLVVLDSDIRTGFDFEAVANDDYRSACQALRDEWAYWRKTAKSYGFGRTELLPVKSTAEGIARYVGKYISKHVSQRELRDKGFRLVEYSRGARSVSTRFAFNTAGSVEWRRKLELFAAFVSGFVGRVVYFEDLQHVLGPQWAYNNRKFIASLPSVKVESGWQNNIPQRGKFPAITLLA
jgi:hypothetical protein